MTAGKCGEVGATQQYDRDRNNKSSKRMHYNVGYGGGSISKEECSQVTKGQINGNKENYKQ